ncbi:MAG: helix-turn-helix domain-containing protein [Clostridia bacterium]|nr:helix-turn-helix domain-containing protein [Clostridia bacterium]
MDNQKNGVRGLWIPREVLLDRDLSALEKIILTEIDALSGDDGCRASNAYLAGVCGCSEKGISSAVSKLAKNGYVSYSGSNGRSRKLLSRLTKSSGLPGEKSGSARQKARERITDKNMESNTERNKKRKSGCAIIENFDPREVYEKAVERSMKEMLEQLGTEG